MQKGHKHTEEAKAKMRAHAQTRDNSNRIKALPRGQKHHRWSEKPTLAALHYRIRTKYGKATNHKCADCEGSAVDWSNEGNYTDNIEDYKPRCRKCHVAKDEAWKKKRLGKLKS